MKEIKCECGNDTFYIIESTIWSGEIVDGKMFASSEENMGIDRITCKKCDKEIDDIEFEVEFS